MKEFGRTLRQIIMVNGKEIGGYAIISAVTGLVGMLITLFMLCIDGAGENYTQTGAMMVVLIGVLLLCFGGIEFFFRDFNMAVSMGKRRKYLVPARYLWEMVNTGMVLLISVLVSLIEELLYSVFYPGAVCAMNVRWFILRPEVFVVCLLCIPMIHVLFGALYLKFANNFMWFFLGLSIVTIWGAEKAFNMIINHPGSLVGQVTKRVVDFFAEAGMPKLLLVYAAVTIAGLLGAMLLVRKQQVTA